MLAIAACASAPEAGDAADAPKASNIRALRWVAPGADKVKALTEAPVECSWLGDRETDGDINLPGRKIKLGKLAFESPALLGGAAARMGLSCSSCHLNGRGNPNFFVEGVSGAPGTADVTSSLFSKTRGDGTFNPVPIPDLAARDGKQIKDRRSPEFRAKVRGLIVEEFDGQEPPAFVFEAVIDYLDSLDLSYCKNPAAQERLSYYTDFFPAMNAAVPSENPTTSSPEIALFYIRVARERLERLYERYPDEGGHGRSTLLDMSNKLAERAALIRDGKPPNAKPADWFEVSDFLRSAPGDRSYYDPDALRAALKK